MNVAVISPDRADTDLPVLAIGRRRLQVVLPRWSDPRVHLSIVTVSLFTIGIGWLDFRLSIPQILAALLTSALIEVAITARRTSMLVWPASALQTASSIALLLRVVGTESNDPWATHGWYYFAGLAALGLLTKHLIRYRGGHVFNPSNIALVIGFLVFGGGRLEPLDLWWGPLDLSMVLVYCVILAGGLLISRRLGLIEMGIAFWATLAFGVGVLAMLDHSMTAQWSISPIVGAHFWWIVMTSPEILIYLFFMLTDPRTVPQGRSARIVFGVLVAAVATLLAAPWHTEFGTKVGLLAGLAVVSATRPLLERVLPRPDSPLDAPRALTRRLLIGPARGTRFGPMSRVIAGMAVLCAFGTGVAFASSSAEQPTQGAIPGFDLVSAVDPGTMPIVAVDDNVYKIDESIASAEGAQELAAALARNLRIEHEALRQRDPLLLTGIDHGYRLEQMQRAISEVRADEPITAPSYQFDALRLMIAYPGGAQAGANAGLVAIGTVTDIEYSAAGAELSRSDGPLSITFTLRRDTSGQWQITDTLAAPRS